jgi:hypothetical protein
MNKLPVSFSEKAAATTTTSGAAGYPIQISAKDLDANFVYDFLEISDTTPQGTPQPFSVDEFTGPGGHTQRRLIFKPAPPSSKDGVFGIVGGALLWLQAPDTGTHVLGAVDGNLKWITTEEC